MSKPYDAVLLIAFGGPTCPEEIRPFLARVTQGLPFPPQRLEEVAQHYEAVGGKSPINEITFRQARALEQLLKRQDRKIPVYVGMRNASPFFNETLQLMADDGVKHALGFILSSHRTEASWERYQKNIADARAELGAGAPEVDYCGGWHDHPLFVQSWVELIQAALTKIDTGDSTFDAGNLHGAQPANGDGSEIRLRRAIANQRAFDRAKARPAKLVPGLPKPQRPPQRSLAGTRYRRRHKNAGCCRI